MEYQIQMVYEKEDVGAMVRAMEYRRQPEKNLRLATKIAYPIFGILLIIVAIGTIAAMLTAGLVSIATIVVMVASMVGGVALLRRAISMAPASSTSTPSMVAERTTMSLSSSGE